MTSSIRRYSSVTAERGSCPIPYTLTPSGTNMLNRTEGWQCLGKNKRRTLITQARPLRWESVTETGYQ